MNLNSCRVCLTNYTNSVKSCIAVLLGSCFSLLPFLARGEVSQSSFDAVAEMLSYMNGYVLDIEGLVTRIDEDTSHIRSDLGNANQALSSIGSSLVDIKTAEQQYLHFLYDIHLDTDSIESSAYTTKYYVERMEPVLRAILSTLQHQTNSASSSVASDILAANPWWATNSAFTLSYGSYSAAYPDDGESNVRAFSFPQFMSSLAGWMSRGSSSPVNSSYVWQNDWGKQYLLSLNLSGANAVRRNYTWFDWVSDAFRSNWVLQASLAREGWTNDYENTAWVLNHFDYAMGDVTNLLGSMVGASDPWWSTNSAFAMTYPALSLVAPHLLSSPNGQPGIQSFENSGMSFPEYMSYRAALENRGASDIYGEASQDSQSWFGAPDFEHWEDALNYRRQATFTFEDWLATMLNTNLSLTTGTYANSYSNIIADAAALGYADYSQPTNVPLPEYQDLISEAQSSAASVELQSAQKKMESTVESLSGMIGTPNSEITVIPEFSVGGIHVDEQKFDFDNDVARAARRICNFLYYVMLFAASFSLLQAEWAYYVNLGRSWIKSGGFG